MKNLSPTTPFRVGDAVAFPSRNALEIAGAVRRVEPKAMAVLAALAGAGGETCTRADLLDALWGPDGGDEALTQAVAQLRRALGDSAKAPSFIATVPKVGYRLVAPVRPTAPPASPSRRLERHGWRAAAAAAVLLSAGVAAAAATHGVEDVEVRPAPVAGTIGP